MGELVDDGDRGPAGEHRADVHLGEHRAPIGDLLSRDDLQAFQQRGRLRPAVGLHEADDHVGAPVVTPVGLVQSGVGLAHARCRAEVDTQRSPSHGTHPAPSARPPRGTPNAYRKQALVYDE